MKVHEFYSMKLFYYSDPFPKPQAIILNFYMSSIRGLQLRNPYPLSNASSGCAQDAYRLEGHIFFRYKAGDRCK